MLAASGAAARAFAIEGLVGEDLTPGKLTDGLRLFTITGENHMLKAASLSGSSLSATSTSHNLQTVSQRAPRNLGDSLNHLEEEKTPAGDFPIHTVPQETQFLGNGSVQRAASGSLSITDGTIVYSGVRDMAIPTDFDGIHLDIDGGNGLDSKPVTSSSEFAGWDINFFFGGSGIAASPGFQPARGDTGNETAVIMLSLGQTVDDSLFYSTGYTGSSDHLGAPGNFQDGISGYLGFKFTPNSGGPALYGWMRLTLTVNTPGAIIHEWAWDTTGAPIGVGVTAIPEPSTRDLLMLLGTCAGLRYRNRSRAHRALR